MDKKTKSGIGAVIAALVYGGAQILDMESRIGALEAIHPELVTGVPSPGEPPEEPVEPPEESKEQVEPESPAGPESAPQEPESAPAPGASEE